MRVCLFGATGSTGRLVLSQLINQDYEVNVLVGDPSKISKQGERLRVVKGDTSDPEKVKQAIAGSVAVIDTLGARANTKVEVERLLGVKKLILETMRSQGVSRYVGVASAGVDAPGDEKGAGYRLAALLSRLTARQVAEGKQKEFELIAGSGLDWTILRVPFITESPVTTKYSTSLTGPPSSRIPRADIAFALVGQLKDSRFVRKAPFIGS